MILSEGAIRLLDSFLAGCDRVMSRAAELPPKDEIDRRVKYRYYFYLEKGTSTFRAFNLLIRNGYLSEAELISRANFELVVDLLYYHTSPIQLSERFEDFFPIASEWQAAALAAEGDTAQIPASEKSRIQASQLHFCRKHGHKKFPRHWSGIDKLIDRARTVGRESTYRTTYRLQSDIAHCGVFSEACYIRFAERALADEMKALDQERAHKAIGVACGDMWDWLRTIEAGIGLSLCEMINDLSDQCAEYSRQQSVS